MNDRTTPTVTVTIQVPSNAPEDVISRVTALGTELGAQGGIDQVLLDLPEQADGSLRAQLWPHRHGTDAMSVALLRKR